MSHPPEINTLVDSSKFTEGQRNRFTLANLDLEGYDQKLAGVEVHQVTFTNNFYNVPEDTNLKITYNGAERVSNLLTKGYYAFTDLQSWFNADTALNAGGASIQLSNIDAKTYTTTVVSSTGQVSIQSGQEHKIWARLGMIPFNWIDSPFTKLWRNATGTLRPMACIQMLDNFFCVCMEGAPRLSAATSQSLRTIIAKVPIVVPFGQSYVWVPPNHVHVLRDTEMTLLKQMWFSLRNSFGELVDPNSDWSMNLHISVRNG